MSHQTGIQADSELRDFFAVAKDGSVRVIKVAIENESLVKDKVMEPEGTWEEDYDRCVLSLLEEKHPCYLLFRFDSKNEMGYEWLFITYSPDFSKVRHKMLYAATRATLKQEFGGGSVREELFGTVMGDVSLEGYLRHVDSKTAPAPLTLRERELEEMREKETNMHIGVDTKHVTIPGIAFPISDDAIDKLEEIRDKEISYVQLSIDIDKEEINLEPTDSDVSLENFKTLLDNGQPRYHFFLFKHTHEGDHLESIVFVYLMPGFSCTIKDRMLYSSCKAPLFQVCEGILKMEIAKKLELSDGSEVSEEFLQDEVHPKKILHRPKFAKPKPPPGRGAKRMTKPSAQTDNGSNNEEQS